MCVYSHERVGLKKIVVPCQCGLDLTDQEKASVVILYTQHDYKVEELLLVTQSKHCMHLMYFCPT